MKSEQSTFNLYWSGIVLLTMIFLLVQLILLRGNSGISETYLSVYTWMAIGDIFLCIVTLAFAFFREPITAHFAPPATSDEYRLIPWTPIKIIVLLLFVGVMFFSVTTAKIQFAPIPKPFNVGFSVSPITETYLASVVPGILEDFMFFWIIPQITFNFIWLIFLIVARLDLRETKTTFLGGMMMAIVISSVGYGLLLPGFATAHTGTYQNYMPAYYSAFAFSLVQSTLYAITGLFLPLAHIVHNALFMLGFAVAISIGGAALMIVMTPMRKENLKNTLKMMKRRIFHE